MDFTIYEAIREPELAGSLIFIAKKAAFWDCGDLSGEFPKSKLASCDFHYTKHCLKCAIIRTYPKNS
jgi:hypothetical protein